MPVTRDSSFADSIHNNIEKDTWEVLYYGYYQRHEHSRCCSEISGHGGRFVNAGMGCLGCAAAHFENIEQGALAHGIDVDALVEGLNEAVGAAE